MPTETEALNRYTDILDRIDAGIILMHKGWYRAAMALAEAKQGKVYRAGGYTTFADFYKTEFESRLSGASGFQYAYAGGVITSLLVAGVEEDLLPKSVNQALALRKVGNDDDRAMVWRQVLDLTEGNPIAREVEQAVKAFLGQANTSQSDEENLPAPSTAITGEAITPGVDLGVGEERAIEPDVTSIEIAEVVVLEESQQNDFDEPDEEFESPSFDPYRGLKFVVERFAALYRSEWRRDSIDELTEKLYV